MQVVLCEILDFFSVMLLSILLDLRYRRMFTFVSNDLTFLIKNMANLARTPVPNSIQAVHFENIRKLRIVGNA